MRTHAHPQEQVASWLAGWLAGRLPASAAAVRALALGSHAAHRGAPALEHVCALVTYGHPVAAAMQLDQAHQLCHLVILPGHALQHNSTATLLCGTGARAGMPRMPAQRSGSAAEQLVWPAAAWLG